MKIHFSASRLLIMTTLVLTASCSYLPEPTSSETARDQERKEKEFGSFLTGKDESGLQLDDIIGGGETGSAAMPVNAILWRAALDTAAVMPITSVDTFGGSIITDWYQNPEDPSRLIKLAIFITDRELRADAIRVEVYLQQRGTQSGEWLDLGRDAAFARQLEDLILTRAREIRATGVLESN